MKNKLHRELAVCGYEAVKALEKHNSESIRRLYYSADRATQFGSLCKEMAARKAPYNQVESVTELEKLCGSIHHQGVVAMIEEPEIQRLNRDITTQWAENKENVLLMDRIGNANNLGAIVRSAAFFGIKNIVIPMDEAQSSITTSSYRVAQGGMEYVHIYCVQSIAHLLSDLKGKMVRLGTDVCAKTPISEISNLTKVKRSDGTFDQQGAIVILGNEEKGISQEVKAGCDYLITIPSVGREIESLNVAQAAAVILYEMSKK